MGSLSSMNKNVECLLSVIDLFTKYPCVKPLIDKNAKTVLHGSLWVDQRKEFDNSLMQK